MINLGTKYPARTAAPSADYPQGSIQNETVPGSSDDGTPLDEDWGNDYEGLRQGLAVLSGQTPTNTPDTAQLSQMLRALIELSQGRAYLYDETGAADAYVLAERTDQQRPAGLFDGQVFEFVPGNSNTGASTLDPFGDGAEDFQMPGGVALPAGAVVAGELTRVRWNAAGNRFELQPMGYEYRSTTVLTAGTLATYNTPPWARAIEIEVIGAGAGCGGSDGQGLGTSTPNVAPAGAGFARLFIPRPSGSWTYTIGAGGAGGAAGNNPGTNGGDSSITDGTITLSVLGAIATSGELGEAATRRNEGQNATSVGSIVGATNGVVGSGVSSSPSMVLGGDLSCASSSGFCPIVGGGKSYTISGNGTNATLPGESGGAPLSLNEATNYAGGDGFRGEIRIKEYA